MNQNENSKWLRTEQAANYISGTKQKLQKMRMYNRVLRIVDDDTTENWRDRVYS